MILKWKKKTYIFSLLPLYLYEVPEDDGKRLLGTLDLIVHEHKRLHEKGRARRHKKVSRALIKWLVSHIRDYGVMPDPFKNAVLEQWNKANNREDTNETIFNND